MKTNIMLLTDSYKISHYKQYPKGTTHIYSYLESRGGQFSEVTFFGLQYYLKKYLQGKVVTQAKIEAAAAIYSKHFGDEQLFNRSGWEYILHEHQGKLPLRIKAVPEGMSVPTGNVLMTIENTDPNCFWLTNFLETILLQVWYGTTVSTQSRAIKKLILRYLESTGDPALITFKLHDFGFRGVSSIESAAIGGAAHLINFMGSDTAISLPFIQDYYKTNMVAGFSIPAAEHSTITSWGRNNEALAYQNMLEQYPEGIVAVVSDSYDIFHACKEIWGNQLKNKILSRNGTLVVRPDSGNPVEVILKVIEILGEQFGFDYNEKNYKVLPKNIRIIQGDGVNYDSIAAILEHLKANKWSADNISFGMGGALLQKVDRDTQKFAFKCSEAIINGEKIAVYKDPITDQGKRSKKGRLKLIKNKNILTTVNETAAGKDLLQTVFENGFIKKNYTFESIRSRAGL